MGQFAPEVIRQDEGEYGPSAKLPWLRLIPGAMPQATMTKAFGQAQYPSVDSKYHLHTRRDIRDSP
ncbi:MAG: hypothetical protein ACKOUR_09890 [Planctomycetota bacterium]